MKKTMLLATVLALAIGASAQVSQQPGPHAILPNARTNAVGVTSIQSAQSVYAAPPIAKAGPNAVNNGPPNRCYGFKWQQFLKPFLCGLGIE
jgi:hypothetical protein